MLKLRMPGASSAKISGLFIIASLAAGRGGRICCR